MYSGGWRQEHVVPEFRNACCVLHAVHEFENFFNLGAGLCFFRVYVYIWEQVVQLGCTMSDTSACDKAAILDSCLLLSVSHLFLVSSI